MYFKQPVEPKKIEPDPENTDPAYIEKINKENAENEKKANDENQLYEKIKKKIKLTFLKGDVFRKKKII